MLVATARAPWGLSVDGEGSGAQIQKPLWSPMGLRGAGAGERSMRDGFECHGPGGQAVGQAA